MSAILNAWAAWMADRRRDAGDDEGAAYYDRRALLPSDVEQRRADAATHRERAARRREFRFDADADREDAARIAALEAPWFDWPPGYDRTQAEIDVFGAMPDCPVASAPDGFLYGALTKILEGRERDGIPTAHARHAGAPGRSDRTDGLPEIDDTPTTRDRTDAARHLMAHRFKNPAARDAAVEERARSVAWRRRFGEKQAVERSSQARRDNWQSWQRELAAKQHSANVELSRQPLPNSLDGQRLAELERKEGGRK